MVVSRQDDVPLSAVQCHWIEECPKPGLGSVGLTEGKGTEQSGAVAVHGERPTHGRTLETPPEINLIERIGLT